jgi:hypothetical protein
LFGYLSVSDTISNSLALQIRWENRMMLDNGSICKISLDGSDFSIFGQYPFSGSWFSHKLKGPGLRYEIGLCIQTGWIVWAAGPYPCGLWPDLRIARNQLVHELDYGEMYLADGGYSDGHIFADTPNGLNDWDQRMKSVCRARHETVNSRM